MRKKVVIREVYDMYRHNLVNTYMDTTVTDIDTLTAEIQSWVKHIVKVNNDFDAPHYKITIEVKDAE